MKKIKILALVWVIIGAVIFLATLTIGVLSAAGVIENVSYIYIISSWIIWTIVNIVIFAVTKMMGK